MLKRPGRRGYTIIEVLIVMAIAGVILLIVFLIVPNAKRVQRNHSRKQAAEFIAAQLDSYKSDIGHLPATTAEGDAFIDDYVENYKQVYDIQFRDTHGPHDYLPELDSIVVQYAHWCNRYGAAPLTDLIDGNDVNAQYYVVWTAMESAPVFCVDNHG